MAKLIYNNIKLDLMKTESYSSKAIWTTDNVDYLFTEIKIEVVGIVDLRLVSSQTAPGGNAGLVNAAIAPASIDDLRTRLMQPRQRLKYQILTQTATGLAYRQVLLAPQKADSPCDVNNGPHPDYCYITSISGDKHAIIRYGITCWINDCSRIVLSNRWSVSTSQDSEHYSTRRMTGRLELRADLMHAANLTPDDFRRILFLPIPDNFVRDDIQVTATSDGRAAEYTVVDREVGISVGRVYRHVTRIEGDVTAGSEMQIKNIRDINVFTPFDTYMKSVPIIKVNGVCRVWGNRYADKEALAEVAIGVLMDKVTPKGGNAPWSIVSAYLSQSIEERFVELRLEILPSLMTQLTAFVGFGVFRFRELMDLDSAMNISQRASAKVAIPGGLIRAGDGVSANDTAPVVNPTLPSNNRGSYLGRLLTQALGGECALPADTPANQLFNDLPAK